jgi:predicted secreted protein
VVSGAAVYLVIWWLVLFMVLPFGVVTQDEAGGETEPGTPGSAPARSRIFLKVSITSIIAAALWVVFYLVLKYELVSLR